MKKITPHQSFFDVVTKGKDFDPKIMDIMVKAYPDFYKEEYEFGLAIYGFALRRKEAGLTVTVKYIRRLRKSLLKSPSG